jgi:diacylglycerol kinase
MPQDAKWHAFLKKKIESVRHSFSGIRIAWRGEFNFKLNVIYALMALILSWSLHLSRIEFLIVLFAIGFVLAAEILNTTLEELCDKHQQTYDLRIAKIKDLAAAFVFVASTTSLIVSCVIFIPHLVALFV